MEEQKNYDLRNEGNYADIAQELVDMLEIIKTERMGSTRFVYTAQLMRNLLFHCAIDEELEDLTRIYRNNPSTFDSSPFGYDPLSVSKFIRQLQQRYPKETNC